MTSKALTMAVFATSLLTGAASFAQTAPTPLPKEGTVFSTHTPQTGGCPALDWHVWVGPKNTLTGMVAMEGMKDVWRVSGEFTGERRFHLNGQEVGGAQRTGVVDGEIRADGALVATIKSISGSSPCNDKTVYVPWFRNGNNAYDPAGRVGGDGG